MLDPEATVARIVLDHPECAPVFSRHRIDFCCHGDVPLGATCEARSLDLDALQTELGSAITARRGEPAEDPRALGTPALIARIISRHHEYLRRTLPFVVELAAKVARVHGEHNPRLHELDTVVRSLSAALVPHLDTEEQSLFPRLMMKPADGAAIARELRSMHEDHLAVGQMLGRIREAGDGFTVPEWGCNSYRTLFAELEHLEADILRHVHLENHVLMPRFG